MLKHLNNNAKHYILRLYNRIFAEHVYPSEWKKAMIIPIIKKRNQPTNPNNYRPISLTNCMSKVFERMINFRLTWILEHKNLLSKYQSCFRKTRSVEDHLIGLESEIKLAQNNGEHLIAIFFDVEKAYERLWRHLVLKQIFTWDIKRNLAICLQTT